MIGYLTLEQMRDQVGRHIQDTGSTRDTKVNEWLNTGYFVYAQRYNWPSLRVASEETLTFVAGDKFLYLPKDCWQLYMLLDDSLENVAEHRSVRTFFDRHAPVISATGVVEQFTDAGERAIKTDFGSSAEKVRITVSTADSFNITIHGIANSDRDEIVEQVTFTSQTQVDTSNDFIDLISIGTDGAQSNLITLSGATSGTEYATISAGERTVTYKRLRLLFPSSDAGTYSIYYKRRPTRFTNDYQVPEIPISHALIEYAIAKQYSQQRKWDSGYQVHMAMAEQLADDTFSSEVQMGDRIEIAAPLPRQRLGQNGRVVVVNNG